jgi:hypothetical protein
MSRISLLSKELLGSRDSVKVFSALCTGSRNRECRAMRVDLGV